MRVLVLGGGGMLGHKLVQTLNGRFQVWTTVRSDADAYARTGICDPSRIVAGVEVHRFDTVVAALGKARPAVVVNCVGIIKQLKAAKDPIESLTINSLFPHRLAGLCGATAARLIHVSTDCVFSGARGAYTEADVPDATDLYGRSKLLGEVDAPSLTLRTSIIGREMHGTTGLLEWFLAREGSAADGYTHATFSGVTTAQLSLAIGDVIEHHAGLSGLYHVAAAPISKHDLLLLIRDAFSLRVDIRPRPEPTIDRSLDGSRFGRETGIRAPDWPVMIRALAADATPYQDWRRKRVA
jgi:dTDP-4-dehydrorhamnose reductase